MSSTRRASRTDASDLAAALSAPIGYSPASRCPVMLAARTVAETDEAGWQAILDAADNPSWSSVALSEVLAGRGIVLHAARIRRHRRRDCACPTSPTT